MKIYKDVLNPWLPKSPSLLKNKYLKDVLSNNEEKQKEIISFFQQDRPIKKNERINSLKKFKVYSAERKEIKNAGKAFKLKSTFFKNKYDEMEAKKLSNSMIKEKSNIKNLNI